jgi:hypothetical protein
MRRITARFSLISGSLGLILATAALTAPALAADQPVATTPPALSAHTHQLHGVVKATPAAGATTFTLTTRRFGDVTVSFAGATVRGRGHASGHGKARSFEVAKATDLKAGDRVIVQGRTSADGQSFVARRVHLLPARNAATRATHLVGTISNVATAGGTTTLTINLANGSSQSVTVSANTPIRPEGKTISDLTVGTKVTVVSKNGAATGVAVMPS